MIQPKPIKYVSPLAPTAGDSRYLDSMFAQDHDPLLNAILREESRISWGLQVLSCMSMQDGFQDVSERGNIQRVINESALYVHLLTNAQALRVAEINGTIYENKPAPTGTRSITGYPGLGLDKMTVLPPDAPVGLPLLFQLRQWPGYTPQNPPMSGMWFKTPAADDLVFSADIIRRNGSTAWERSPIAVAA